MKEMNVNSERKLKKVLTTKKAVEMKNETDRRMNGKTEVMMEMTLVKRTPWTAAQKSMTHTTWMSAPV
jgi:hypothetical protein